MKQEQIKTTAIPNLSTSEWYQQEKDSFALSSPSRPKVEKTLSFSFRQTLFPSVIQSVTEES